MLLWKSHDPSRARTISLVEVFGREFVRETRGNEKEHELLREERRRGPSWVGCSRELKGQECLTAIFQWSHRVSYRRRDLSPHPWPLDTPCSGPISTSSLPPPPSFLFLLRSPNERRSYLSSSPSRASNAFPGIRRFSSLPLPDRENIFYASLSFPPYQPSPLPLSSTNASHCASS